MANPARYTAIIIRMQSHKLALLSRCIIADEAVCPQRLQPFSGVVLIADGLIEAIIGIENVLTSQCDIERLREEYTVQDLGDLCVFPGVVDLSVELNGESLSTVTKAGAAGGVTTLATHQVTQGDCYTDIAPLGVLTDSSQFPDAPTEYFGLQACIGAGCSPFPPLLNVSEGLRKAQQLSLPVFIQMTAFSEKSLALISPGRMVDTTQREMSGRHLDRQDEDSTDEALRLGSLTLYPTPISHDPGVMRRTSLKVPTFVKPFDSSAEESDPSIRSVERKRISLPSIFSGLSKCSKKFAALSSEELMKFRKTGGKENVKRGSWMSSSSESISGDCSLPRTQPTDSSDLLLTAKSDYAQHLLLYPPEAEVEVIQAVLSALTPQSMVHICAVGAAEAVQRVAEHRRRGGQRVTVSTAVSFLHYTEADIQPGDTRLKCIPPIRDLANQHSLWCSLTTGEIDCITSHHQPHCPGSKFLGSFQRAKSGITAIGLSLQVAWSHLIREDGDLIQKLYRLAEWVSSVPAEILGVSRLKGSLRTGKHADIVVWDPTTMDTMETLFYAYPSMCPFRGERLAGTVYFTYVRGNLVYSREGGEPAGRVLDRSEFWKAG